MTRKEYTFIDLFAGIGGFHLAFHNLGATCVFAAEWDEAARKTYQANYQFASPNLFDGKDSNCSNFVGDITAIDPNSIPDHDVLCAGFPCQPFSQAGFRKGFEDARGTLFFNIAEILKVKQPKAFFLENVRGLLNHDEGKTFTTIKQIVEDLGYSFHHSIIRASDYNLPQHRPRLYMVGFRNKADFNFPEPQELTYTMREVFDGAKVNKDIGFTLRVGGRGSRIDDRRNWEHYLVNDEVTRISVKEAKRMQGFPESFVFPVSEVQAMKQLGNSVAVSAVQATASEILTVLDEAK